MTERTLIVIPPRRVNMDVIDRLEYLLSQAKNGEVQSLMYICDMNDKTVEAGWTGCEHLYLLAGHCARLQHLLQKRLDDS